MATTPTVYIETTIIGHLTARLPNDPLVVGQMLATRKWWDEARLRFEILSSEAVRVEVAQGDPIAAAERLKKLEGMPLLQLEERAMNLAERLLTEHALPAKANIDAIHVALAASNSIEY